MDAPTSYNIVTRLREANLKALKIKDKKEITVMSKMMEKGYEVKHAEQKVICTKKFLLDSSDMMNDAFEQMCKLRAMFPDYAFEQYVIEKNANKQTYGKLTYENMRKHIRGKETPKRAEVMLKELNAVIDMSQSRRASYAYVKKWFLSVYKDDFKTKKQLEEEEYARILSGDFRSILGND